MVLTVSSFTKLTKCVTIYVVDIFYRAIEFPQNRSRNVECTGVNGLLPLSTVTEPIFTKFKFTLKLSAKSFCVEFHENPKRSEKKRSHADGR